MRDAPDMTGKVAIVTGATSGVGRGIATAFARRGALVVATGRRTPAGQELEAAIRAEGHELTFVEADVTRAEDCERVTSVAVEKYNFLDVLVCNAGTVGSPGVQSTHLASLDWWDSILTTNLTGTFLSCRAALPQMLEQGHGLIFTIASLNAEVPLSRMSAYNASKAAVVQFTKSLALEYQAFGIRANPVILGGAEGDTKDVVHQSMLESMGINAGSGGEDDASRALAMPAVAVGESLAALSSGALAPMTGSSIHLDGGLSMGALTDLAITMTVSGQWAMPTA
ncbi:MAG: short-chain dehydrogenase [Aeromicrobium sp.]|nr:short-chain dehydrogenase [Aeromicrobium sp.]